MRCTVFGTGYLGATHAAGMAELGHDVIGVDVDPKILGIARAKITAADVDVEFVGGNLRQRGIAIS